mmetsp:Transcript_669/g.1645  ORF Transcript_669/g.1645 Transcript_669/m.1645 type:complete len:651 (-) Transcript_669:85-2037(-)
MAEGALDLFAMAAALADSDDDEEIDEEETSGADGALSTAASRQEQLDRFIEEANTDDARARIHCGDLEIRDVSTLTAEEFQTEFEGPGKPMAVLGCANEWAAKTWTSERLVDLFGDASFALYTGQKFTLREYVSYAQGRGEYDECPLYLFEDLSDRENAIDEKSKLAHDAILQSYSVPMIFEGRDLYELPEGERPEMGGRPRFRWMLIGPARSGTRIHYDPVGTSAWNTLLEGHKRWVLIPPDVDAEVVKQFRQDVNVERWFAEVLPQLDHEALGVIEFTQGPGDTVFVPRGWWHIVINLDMTVAVTQNFASEANLEQVADAMRLQKYSPYKNAWFDSMLNRYPNCGFERRVPLPAIFQEGQDGCKSIHDRPELWASAEEEKTWTYDITERYNSLWFRPRRDLEEAKGEQIPRIVHHIWLGSKNIPNRGEWMKTWKRFLDAEGWTFRFWRDADCEQLDMVNRKAFENASNLGEKSDIARYEILRQYGGVYVDIDFECVRSISEFMNEMARFNASFICGLSNVGALEVNNAFIASIPHHPILEALNSGLTKDIPSFRDLTGGMLTSYLSAEDSENLTKATETTSTIAKTGPGYFTKTVLPRVSGDNSVLVLPPVTLYPLSNTANPEETLSTKDYAAKGCLAVHHWACSWQS